MKQSASQLDFVLEAELASHIAAYMTRWSTLKAFMACRAREVHRGRSEMRKWIISSGGPSRKRSIRLSRNPLVCYGRTEKDRMGQRWSHGREGSRWLGTWPSRNVASSYIGETSTRATAATDRASENKTTKYTDLAKTHHFVPITIETGGAWNELALEFITELGRRISGVTQEPRETQFICQQLSISLQRGNAVVFKNTFSSE